MKRALTIAMLVLWSVGAFAQLYNTQFRISWSPEYPLMNKDFAKDFSIKGIEIGYDKFLGDKFSVGLEASSSVFEAYLPRATRTYASSAFTSDFQNYSRIVTVAASGAYYFRSEGRVIPYSSLGLGAGFTNYDEYFNAYSNSASKTGFMARPAVGVLLRLRDYSKTGLRLGLHADYVSAKLQDLDAENFFNVGFNVGLAFFEE